MRVSIDNGNERRNLECQSIRRGLQTAPGPIVTASVGIVIDDRLQVEVPACWG